jgi:hypothetical protein
VGIICAFGAEPSAGAHSTQIREWPRGSQRSGHISLQTEHLLQSDWSVHPALE